jgi:hypothetical protein
LYLAFILAFDSFLLLLFQQLGMTKVGQPGSYIM